MTRKKTAPVPAQVIGDNCFGCTFWQAFEMTPAMGRCRRFPPTPLMGAGCEQPTTRFTSWCGEWAQAAAEAERRVGFAPPALEQDQAA